MSMAETIWRERYAHPGEESWSDTAKRVARFIAGAESVDKQEEWFKKFFEIIDSKQFIPGGRILANSGRPQANLLNCFTIPLEDSRESIGQMLKEFLIISGTGGGVGISFSKLRPKGTSIITNGGESSGPISFMDCVDQIASTIKTGGQRRAAILLSMSVYHPDILDFIHHKIDMSKLTNANVSIEIDSKFLSAVKEKRTWDLIWANKVVKTVNAKDIWDKIVENALLVGEPGVLNMGLAREQSNSEYFNEIICTNPCISADTLVATADGRGEISIKELADKGDDVPVYCLDSNGNTSIRIMRNPRITGYKQPIFTITLDDGSVFRTTGNHKVRLKNGDYKEVKDLINGDSLHIMTKYHASIKDIFSKTNSRSQDYIWVNNGRANNYSEHRLIAAFYNSTTIPRNYVVHHKDHNAQNNKPENLLIMPKEDHDILHNQNMIGDNNPMRRAQTEWSDKKWQTYRDHMSEATGGEMNGRFSGYTNQQIKDHVIKITKKIGRRISWGEWEKYARIHGLPLNFCKWREDHLGGILGLFKWAALECGYDHIDVDPRLLKRYQKLLNDGYDCQIDGNTIVFNKKCEICTKNFKTLRRETGICSNACAMRKATRMSCSQEAKNKKAKNKNNEHNIVREQQAKIYSDLRFALGRDPVLRTEFKKACQKNGIIQEIGRRSSPFKNVAEIQEAANRYNHKVVSVIMSDHEDVYNGTVDEYHNFFIGGWESKTKSGKPSKTFINNLQCGEVFLPAYGCCCLGSLNLSSFVSNKNEFQWEEFRLSVSVGIRFLDNVLSVNTYPLPEIKVQSAKERRIGLGIMGLHHAMLKMGIKYSSADGLEFTEKIYEVLRNVSYMASSALATEKGPFPAFDSEKYLASGFTKTLPTKIRSAIRKNGMRNVCVNTQAPCGTTSIIAETSSGIEPIFAPMYTRRYNTNKGYAKETLMDPLLREFIKSKRSVSHFEGAYDISPEKHFAIQEAAQRYIDNSVSKSVNLPVDYTSDKLNKTWLKYADTLKGATLYRQGSRGKEPLTPVEIDTKLADVQEAESSISTEACKDGKCSI